MQGAGGPPGWQRLGGVCHAARLSQPLIALSSSAGNKGSLSKLIPASPGAFCSPTQQPGMRGAPGLTHTPAHLAWPGDLTGTHLAWGPQEGMLCPGETFRAGAVPAPSGSMAMAAQGW